IVGTVGSGQAAPIAAATPSGGSAAAEAAGGDGVTVTATGETVAVPDELHVSLAVEVTRPRADAALTAASGAAVKVVRALEGAGVGRRDLQTNDLEVSPEYGGASESVVTGWTARISWDVTVNALSRAGRVLDAAIGAGGASIRIDAVSYDVRDKE